MHYYNVNRDNLPGLVVGQSKLFDEPRCIQLLHFRQRLLYGGLLVRHVQVEEVGVGPLETSEGSTELRVDAGGSESPSFQRVSYTREE